MTTNFAQANQVACRMVRATAEGVVAISPLGLVGFTRLLEESMSLT